MKFAATEQSVVVALHASIPNFRSAVKRNWPAPIIALTRTLETLCAPPPSATVALVPATEGVRPVAVQFVFSVSSISLASSSAVPSPAIDAPFAEDAQFVCSLNVTAVAVGRERLREAAQAVAGRLHDELVRPGTNFAVFASVVPGSVSASGMARSS